MDWQGAICHDCGHVQDEDECFVLLWESQEHLCSTCCDIRNGTRRPETEVVQDDDQEDGGELLDYLDTPDDDLEADWIDDFTDLPLFGR